MKFEAMFQPVKIGNMTVPNRFVMSPMGNNFANTDGKMSERSAAYYGAGCTPFSLSILQKAAVSPHPVPGARRSCIDSSLNTFSAYALSYTSLI